MEKYADKNLLSDEKIELRAKFSVFCLVGPILWLIVALVIVFTIGGATKDIDELDSMLKVFKLVLIVLGVLPLLKKIIILMTTDLAITNKRVIGKTGVLKIETLDLHIDKVESVELKAKFFERLFGLNSIGVKGSGASSITLFHGIANATQFKNAVTESIEKHAAEARRAQAEEIARAMGKK